MPGANPRCYRVEETVPILNGLFILVERRVENAKTAKVNRHGATDF